MPANSYKLYQRIPGNFEGTTYFSRKTGTAPVPYNALYLFITFINVKTQDDGRSL